MIEALFLILGLIVLILGSTLTIESSKKVATSLGISELIIGLTIVAIGTSLPEIANNIMAGINISKGVEASGIAIGNIIGSNIMNLTLTLALCGILARLKIKKKIIQRDVTVMLLSIVVLFLFSLDAYISTKEASILVFLYLVYLIDILKTERIKELFVLRVVDHKSKKYIINNLFLIITGVILVISGSDIVVRNGVNIARSLNIEETIIGIFISIGTALPELIISVRAVLEGSKSLSVGNIIGSNIINPLLALGLGGSIAGFNVERTSIYFDLPVLFMITVLTFLFMKDKLDLNRKEGIVLITLYLLFMIVRVFYISF